MPISPLPPHRSGRLRPRAFALVGSLVLAGATMAACGSDGGAAGAADGNAAANEESAADDPLLAFAQCMRDHGFDVQDPGGGGGIAFGGLDADDSEQAEAIDECRESSGLAERGIGPGVRTGDGNTQPADMDALIDFVDCMRDEGIDMPDPTPEGGIVPPEDFTMRAGRGGPFQDAMDACREHLAGGGIRIMRGDS